MPRPPALRPETARPETLRSETPRSETPRPEAPRSETPRPGSAARDDHRPRVLLVEDSTELAWTYRQFLEREPVALDHVTTGGAALARLERETPAVLLLDLRLPDMDGMEILERVVRAGWPTAVVVITGYGSIELAVSALQAGAYDFLAKPFQAERLIVTVRNALERQRLSNLVEAYRRDPGGGPFHGFIGTSPAMQAVYRTIESAAASRATVFITGESGTGKELCAHAVHAAGPRRAKTFMALNCAALPRELIESEIFGHVRGAFTGAVAPRVGAVKLADGGTLFLDEVCDMDPALQSKLLRFVQTGTFRPVGSDRAETVDVRLICATNKDPRTEVAAGRFREDLYYRLHVIPIHIPPLRERGTDVLRIARHCLALFAREEGKAFRAFDPEAEAALAAYPWPGNVRQLQNAIRNVVVLHDGEVVRRAMLSALDGVAPGAPAAPAGARPPGPIRPLCEAERELIERALARCQGNVARAAQLLQVSPSTIYRKRNAWARRRGSA